MMIIYFYEEDNMETGAKEECVYRVQPADLASERASLESTKMDIWRSKW